MLNMLDQCLVSISTTILSTYIWMVDIDRDDAIDLDGEKSQTLEWVA